MHFTQAPMYVERFTRLHTEQFDLSCEIVALGNIPPRQRHPEQRKRLQQAKSRLKTLEGQKHRMLDLSEFTWPEVVKLLIEVEGCAWTPVELELLAQELVSFEGRGEKPLRHRLGLPLRPTLETCDLPNWEEVKYVGPMVEAIRIGNVGKKMYGRLARELTRQFSEDYMAPEQWELLATGEVSAGKLYHGLPEPVRAKLQQELAPANALRQYSAIYATTDTGFVRIPWCDYSHAWGLSCVTQMSPKYRLKRDYVERRITTGSGAPTVAARPQPASPEDVSEPTPPSP